MDISRLPFVVITGLGLLCALAAPQPDCWALDVNFINGGDFNSANNWDDGMVPSADFDSHYVQDDLTAVFSSGDTSVHFLTIGDTSYGRLEMSGGSLTVLAPDQFEVGESVGGEGEVVMTGSSLIIANGAVIGPRAKGTITIGPDATFDMMDAGDSKDLRVGSFGPAFVPGGDPEPGLDGDGLVDVQGTLNVASLIISQSGAKGEVRLSGGTVNVAGILTMDLCEGCGTDPSLLAMRASKVSLIGSSGSFNVGSDIYAISPTTTFSFTADAGGVTTIVAENGIAEIESANLELDLDAFPFTPTSKLTLIDALDIPGLLYGEFGTVTFLGSTQADVNYDGINSDVYLDNFRIVGGISGDFDGNGDYDCGDIDSLVAEVVAMTNNPSFDLTGDGDVNILDVDAWLAEAGAAELTSGQPYLPGDANLDGVVDVPDFNIWNGNKFTQTAAWCLGDFNADGVTDVPDFNIWNGGKFTSSDVNSVPEPAAGILAALGLVMLFVRKRTSVK